MVALLRVEGGEEDPQVSLKAAEDGHTAEDCGSREAPLRGPSILHLRIDFFLKVRDGALNLLNRHSGTVWTNYKAASRLALPELPETHARALKCLGRPNFHPTEPKPLRTLCRIKPIYNLILSDGVVSKCSDCAYRLYQSL